MLKHTRGNQTNIRYHKIDNNFYIYFLFSMSFENSYYSFKIEFQGRPTVNYVFEKKQLSRRKNCVLNLCEWAKRVQFFRINIFVLFMAVCFKYKNTRIYIFSFKADVRSSRFSIFIFLFPAKSMLHSLIQVLSLIVFRLSKWPFSYYYYLVGVTFVRANLTLTFLEGFFLSSTEIQFQFPRVVTMNQRKNQWKFI